MRCFQPSSTSSPRSVLRPPLLRPQCSNSASASPNLPSPTPPGTWEASLSSELTSPRPSQFVAVGVWRLGLGDTSLLQRHATHAIHIGHSFSCELLVRLLVRLLVSLERKKEGRKEGRRFLPFFFFWLLALRSLDNYLASSVSWFFLGFICAVLLHLAYRKQRKQEREPSHFISGISLRTRK